MKFVINGIFSKCEQIRRKLRIGSHLLKKSSMENFIICAVVLSRSPNYVLSTYVLYFMMLYFKQKRVKVNSKDIKAISHDV